VRKRVTAQELFAGSPAGRVSELLIAMLEKRWVCQQLAKLANVGYHRRFGEPEAEWAAGSPFDRKVAVR
jgi:hypothetical protein